MFLETILCREGKAHHLPYHQRRLDATLRILGFTRKYTLSRLITPPQSGVYRCRFLYDGLDFTIEYHPYVPRTISSLRVLIDDTINYPLKTTEREALEALYRQRDGCDDVVIVRNGFLSDTTVANIAVFDGYRWLTPEKPLLEGTTRSRLIEEGTLFPAPLRLDDIAAARKIAVMNALMGFVEVENGIII
ncbi:MAG: aminotransferase class IV [Sulfuricurvum sp.]|jgi:4-amino-4-deoxychorismate lyase|uniref:aminotransferase class IV n=1 Tax=Sulfuricurvum sp. TaxID=2025608 RepID=UPI0025DF2B3C|nr:aminotransferase class IV [Sulfuricurvum sp.]MCK9373042.1 aminotransferase class IV [Sulfuricurvum sp.]